MMGITLLFRLDSWSDLRKLCLAKVTDFFWVSSSVGRAVAS